MNSLKLLPLLIGVALSPLESEAAASDIALTAPVNCSTLVTPLQIKTGEEFWWRTPNQFYYQDPQFDFEFKADFENGAIRVQMKLKDRDMGIRSRYKASDLYHRAFEHFGPFNIQRAEFQWLSGENYDTFHSRRDAGLAIDTAARATWTGQMLTELGMSHVTSVELEHNTLTGKHDGVHVVFQYPLYEKLTPKQGTESFDHTDDMFNYVDHVYGFAFFAMIYGDGQVFIAADLTNPGKGIRSRFSGKVLFAQMIEHFGVENIRVIEDLYHGTSTNRAQYFTHRANGKSPEQAALGTWSGQRAVEHGFSEVFDVEEIWKDEVYDKVFTHRRMGGRHIVNAKFRRPTQ